MMAKIKFLKTGYETICQLSHIKCGSVKDELYDPNIGRVFSSNTSGEFIIVNRCERVNKNRLYRVRFVDTGFETFANYGNILSGKVKDKSLYTDHDAIIGQIFESNNFGKFIVLNKDKTPNYYIIEFIKTKYRTSAKYINIIEGKVKDFLYPTNCGIGYIGIKHDVYYTKDRLLYKRLYTKWNSMISRCYNQNNKWYKSYGAQGVKVDERWHCFCNFYEDAYNLPNFNRDLIVQSNGLELDKDKIQQNVSKMEKIYSKDTCCWLSREENLKLRFNMK